jgi:hypothetical protein
MTNAPTPFDVPESDVAQKTGLSFSDVKKARGPKGRRWEKTANGRVMWCSAGVAELERQMAKESHSEAAPEQHPKNRPEAYVVARIRTLRVLHVIKPGESYNPAHPLCVWLPQPRGILFRPGMKVAARKRAGQPNVMDFEGNPGAPEKGRRMPRKVGFW